MNYVISDGSTKAIIVGSQIKVKPGYLPSQFDNQWIAVLALDSQGPMAALEDHLIDDAEAINSASCISPSIITQVV